MSKKYPLLDDKEWLEAKYWGEKLSALKIAKIIGCSRTSVLAALKRFNIPRRSFSEAQKGRVPGNKGKKVSEETRQKMREAQKGEKSPNYGKHRSEETRKKLSDANKGKKLSEETKKKISDTLKGEKNHNYGKHPSEESRRKMSESTKKNWQNPDYIKKVFDGLNMKPNELEKKVGGILQKHLPDEYAYNGDFSCGITIGGKIPDFVNVNGEKIVIEVFGPWHDEKYMRDHFGDDISWKRTEFGTKAHYSQFGYKCVVFWQEELEREDAEQFVLSVLRDNKII